MSLRKELFFPTPVYFVDLEDAAALNAFLKVRIRTWRERDSEGITRSNVSRVGSWHSTTTMAERPEFALFVRKVDAAMSELYVDQLYSENNTPKCLNMWANINPRNGYNRSHTHPGGLWSGVYYVQTPKDCGSVIFQDPRAQAHMSVVERKTTADAGPEQWSEVFHAAKEGRLIIFPSWLRHEVEPNMSELTGAAGDRISISFNYGQNG